MKVRRKIGDLGKAQIQQLVQDFLDELDEGAVALLEYFEEVDNPEFETIELDGEGKILSFTAKDGSHYLYNVKSESLDALADRIKALETREGVTNFEEIEDPESRLQIGRDNEGKIYNYRKPNGVLVETAGIETPSLNLTGDGLSELERDLKNHGFTGGQGDWSDKSDLYIPEPRFAIVNITNGSGSATMPHAKFVDYKYYMQVWDMNGNYFKKEVIMNGQGNSSMGFLKDNFAVDICNNNGWDDDDTFKLKIGDWVPQDSFHFKAFYNDFVRGSSIIAYKVADRIEKSRGPKADRPWKKALLDIDNMGTDTTNMVQIDDLTLQFDTDAKCHPDGFPCAVYVEGSFYGLYAWCIKKHRDNYHQDKGKATQIHLDGDLTNSKFWKLNVLDWTGFEVRNPKDIVYLVPLNTTYPITKKGIKAAWSYDADVSQAELAGISSLDTDISAYDSTHTYYIGQMCKNNGRYFISIVDNNIGNTPTAEKKAKNIWDTAASDGHWLDITHTNSVKKSILELCTRMQALTDISTIETNNGTITIGDFAGDYNSTDNFSKGVFVKDGANYYMSLHSTNAGNPTSDTNYWINIDNVISDIKDYVEDYFDIENIIDYQITQMVTGDTDGYGKNWQWITYNGTKWFVTEYDKDMAFGNHYTGQCVTSPIRERAYLTDSRAYWIWGYLRSYPIGWVVNYYRDEIVSRWKWLYENDIITSSTVIKELTDWCSRIGEYYFEKEYSAVDYDGVELGKLSPCNRDDYVDTDNWERTNNRITSGNFTYDDNTIYQQGDTCYYGKPGQNWGFQFVAKKETKGNPPITQFYDEYPYNLGYRDSIWRFINYIEETISLQNSFINSL